MATYYVRKTGNDSAPGDGSNANPWLTINKALATVSIGGGHTILVGDGIYSENTSSLNYLLANRAFSDWVTVQPELGASGDVTLTNPGHATYCVRLDNSRYVRLKWLKITAGADITSENTGLVHLSGTSLSNFEFIGCTITVRSVSGKICYGFIKEAITTQSLSNILFEDCTIVQTGAFPNVYGIRVDKAAIGASIDNITIKNCDITVTGMSIYLPWGVTNILIDGGNYQTSGTGVTACEIGVNGAASYTLTGTIKNATFISTSGHALLIGGGCQGVIAQNNTVVGGDQGIVVKNCDAAVITSNIVTGGSDNALYFKGATNAISRYNIIVGSVGILVKVGVDSGTGNKCQNITITYNKIYATRTASLFDWGDSTGDLGGGVCDYNIYKPHGTGKFGAIVGDADVNTLVELRTAWVGYGDGTNDSHSRMFHAAVVAHRGLKRRIM